MNNAPNNSSRCMELWNNNPPKTAYMILLIMPEEGLVAGLPGFSLGGGTPLTTS